MKYSVIIADDHPFTAEGMEAVITSIPELHVVGKAFNGIDAISLIKSCLLYTSPSPRDRQKSRMPSSA